MVFKKLLAALGVGGPSVDTVLTNPATRPGLSLEGQVLIRGGDHPVDIEHVALGLVTQMEVEGGDTEFQAATEFHRVVVSEGFHLAAGQELSIPFSFPVPWETPITTVFGQHLHGMVMGLRTELAVARAVDKGDLDPVQVHPLPAQEAVLDAFGRLGFQFKGADLEHGHIRGLPQTLPFYQEIEFYAAPAYAHACREVEVTFVTTPQAVDVVLEIDGGSHDIYLHFQVPHTDTTTDWAQYIDSWFQSTVLPNAHLFHGGGHKHEESHGSGLAGVIGGAALGFVGGMVAGEVLEEVAEEIFEDEEE